MRPYDFRPDALARIISTLAALACLLAAAPAPAGESRDPYAHFFHPLTGDLKAELADARSERRKAVFVMFEQEGCPSCLHMKTRVLNRPDVQKFYRDRFFNFAVDINGAVPITDFAGRGHTEKSYARSARVRVTPTLVFVDLDGTEVVRIEGPVRDAREFILLGEFVASGAYRTSRFADYRSSVQPRAGAGDGR